MFSRIRSGIGEGGSGVRPSCSVSLPVAMMQYADEGNLREKQFVLAPSSVVQSIMVRKGWRQELEAADHSTLTTEEQRAANAHPTPFLHLVCLS